jgi:hypothetical protein
VYALPFVGVSAAGAGFSLRIPLLASTWDPYNVVLFRTTLEVQPI